MTSVAATRIEDYALIGNTLTAALVHRDATIDWLCLPRFDSDAVFASLVGDKENGCWSIAPRATVTAMRRRYRPETLILETELETASGAVAIIDFMPPPTVEGRADIVRIVEGRRGRVDLTTTLGLRFGYGRIVPWVRRIGRGITAIAGPDAVRVETPVPLKGRNMHTVGEFTVAAGDRVPFTLTWFPSHHDLASVAEAETQLDQTEAWWCNWVAQASVPDRWRVPVIRSLITLKALTYGPTGGIVAAATTSLPEQPGGPRNWDYRYCWLRDATLTLRALLVSGFHDEARAWRQWLLRSAAGKPAQVQIMYGVAGEQRLTEMELPWLKGFANSKPVRIGNQAHEQFQLDVYGEVIRALHLARSLETEADDDTWRLQKVLLRFLEKAWHEPDEGIWEVRGPRRHFVHSKVMAWAAFSAAIDAVEHFGFEGPVETWRAVRDQIHEEVCEQGFNSRLNSFVQYYGADTPDAALLAIALTGFLPHTDSRVVGTVEAIQRELSADGMILRYRTQDQVDGLPPGEGAFLACSFWFVDVLHLMGRTEEAEAHFERLLRLSNDVGLLAEEIEPRTGRHLGNFPQAFSHVGLVNSAVRLSRPRQEMAAEKGHRATPAG